MDAGTSSKRTRSAAITRLITRIRWLPVSLVGMSALAVLALLRYAIDLLVPSCAMLLLPRSIRDAVGDWLAGDGPEGEPAPVWAIGVIGVHLFGTVLGLLWIFSTSSWAANIRMAEWIPAPVIGAARFAEAHGWGRRAVLRGGPVSLSEAPPGAPRSATVGESRREADAGRSTSLARASPRTPETVAGTSGQPSKEPHKPEQGSRPISTSVTLSSSASVLHAGSELQLTASVTASRERPDGSVVFRRVFRRGDAVMGSAPLDAHGRAVLTVRALPRGTHTITAVFTGGARFAESRSGSLRLFVTP